MAVYSVNHQRKSAMQRCTFLLALLLTGHFLFGQKDNITKLVEQFESSSKHDLVIKEINEILGRKDLSQENRLAVQTALIHQYQELQKWDTCLNYCQLQITLAQQQNNLLAAATFYKLIGNTYYHIPDKEKAVLYWEKSIAISEPNHYSLLLEQCYHNISAIYIEKEINFSQAEKYLQEAIQLSIANKTDTTPLGNLHYRLLATLYERTNQLSKAESLYDFVMKRSREMNDTARLTEALMFYSDVLVKEKKYQKAIETSNEALLLSKKINRLDLTKTALTFHSKNLYLAGRYKEAYDFKAEEAGLVVERFNGDLNTKISEAEARFKNAEIQHEKEMAIVKAKKEKQIYTVIFISLLCLAAVFFYSLYQRRNVKQKLQMQQQLQEEKERLSRDLHDNLGSQMALLSNNMESLDINFKKQQDIGDRIEKLKGTSRQLLQTLREAIWILNKEQVTAQEFFDKLIDYTRRYLTSYPGIQLRVKENFPQNRVLNSNEALQLFRICQEAITNACKYAGSNILLLEGTTVQDGFRINIQDNGSGFDMKLKKEEGHYGLKNMADRARAIKAVLHIDTAPGKGASVTITL
jgi:signal transduction histidine kinase